MGEPGETSWHSTRINGVGCMTCPVWGQSDELRDNAQGDEASQIFFGTLIGGAGTVAVPALGKEVSRRSPRVGVLGAGIVGASIALHHHLGPAGGRSPDWLPYRFRARPALEGEARTAAVVPGMGKP